MFGKMMNRFYYGKSGKADYTRDDLPETRWQLFWEMLRVRFAALFRLNLMYMMAWLPAMIVIGRGLFMAYSGLVNLSNLQMQLEAGEIAAEMLSESTVLFWDAIKAIALQTLLLLVPAIGLTGPFTAGVAYVTRNWARDEHSFIWSDFWDAVKGNWKQALPTSIITGLTPLLLYVCTAFYWQMAQNSMLFLVPGMLVIALCMLWLMSLLYAYPQMVTYELSYAQLIRNSLMMALARLPITAGLKLLSIVPTLLCAAVCVTTPYAAYAVLALGAYYALIGFALSRFIQASCANAAFDRYINVNLEGVEVGRGLYKEEDEEDEEEAPIA